MLRYTLSINRKYDNYNNIILSFTWEKKGPSWHETMSSQLPLHCAQEFGDLLSLWNLISAKIYFPILNFILVVLGTCLIVNDILVDLGKTFPNWSQFVRLQILSLITSSCISSIPCSNLWYISFTVQIIEVSYLLKWF